MHSDLTEILKKILEFERGNSFIIKGPPGSGKTTFALSLLNNVKGKSLPVYFSTRVGDASLYQQFPWLKKMEKNIKILITAEEFLSELSGELKEKEYKEAARALIREISEKREVSRIFYKMLFNERKLPEIQHFYREVESNLPKKSIIVIDSLEGISGKYNINESLFAYMIQKDLVESADATVIFVSEKDTQSPEDYVVDGIIRLSYRIDDGRRFREISITKLRGMDIQNSGYAFTLNSGKFHTFGSFEMKGKKVSRWIPIKDGNGYYSTGIEDLDRILEGGIKYGSFFNIQVEKEVSPEVWRMFETPVIINFFSLNYGVFGIPTPGYSYNTNKKYFSQWIQPDVIDSNTFYIDYSASESDRPNLFALGGLSPEKASTIHIKAVSDFLNKFEKGLFIINHDFLEYSLGPEITLKNIFTNLSSLRSSKAIVISITKPGQRISSEISNISDYQMRLLTRNGAVFLYGIKPRTIYYGIEIDEKRGFPYIKLVPVS